MDVALAIFHIFLIERRSFVDDCAYYLRELFAIIQIDEQIGISGLSMRRRHDYGEESCDVHFVCSVDTDERDGTLIWTVCEI